MNNPFNKLGRWLDRTMERRVRQSAQQIGRRNLLANLGQIMVGAAVIPLLPYDRSGTAHAAEDFESKFKNTDDETACDYWRYCALSGALCTCCGGSLTSCPPNTEASKVTWVGTCQNPEDGKHYLVSYNDCCGQSQCTQCRCSGHERERPGYRMGLYNGINWCIANNAHAYHCTVSVLVGVAENAA